jgi:hypothetical protein
MPYYLDPNLEKNQQQNGQNGQPKIASGAPSSDATAGISSSGGQQRGSTPKSNTGSNFTNLDQYLNANAGSGFGSQVAGKVQESLNQANTDQNEQTQKLSSQINSQQGATHEQIQGAIDNPESANAQQYQNWINQTYNGPTSFNANPGNTDATQKAQYFYGAGGNGISGGAQQMSLLNSYFGNNNHPYTSGQQKLDQALLVNDQGYQRAASGINSGSQQLNRNAYLANQNLQNQASSQAANIANSAANARSAIGIDAAGNVIQGPGAGAIGQLESQVNANTAIQNAQNKYQYNQLTQDVANNTLSDQDKQILTNLGINLNNPSYGAGLSSANFTLNAPFTNSQVMTPEQQARILALQGLAGVNDNFASGPLSNYNQAVAAAQANYQKDLSSALKDARSMKPIQSNAEDQNTYQTTQDPKKMIDILKQNLQAWNAMGGYSNPSIAQNIAVANQKINSLTNLMNKYGIT